MQDIFMWEEHFNSLGMPISALVTIPHYILLGVLIALIPLPLWSLYSSFGSSESFGALGLLVHLTLSLNSSMC